MELPKRKNIRLTEYNYQTPGAYFVTVCTKDRCSIFWENVGASIARPQEIKLTACGVWAKEAVESIEEKYPAISVEAYVIMPNHIHLLLQIHAHEDGRAMLAPTLSIVVQQMKGFVTKKVGYTLWQKGFYDHVIRNEKDFWEISEYIQNNPIKWIEDEFYT